ncbi:MAG: hypothetical protein RL062_71, partial [Bacteroidota bacterium]
GKSKCENINIAVLREPKPLFDLRIIGQFFRSGDTMRQQNLLPLNHQLAHQIVTMLLHTP